MDSLTTSGCGLEETLTLKPPVPDRGFPHRSNQHFVGHSCFTEQLDGLDGNSAPFGMESLEQYSQESLQNGYCPTTWTINDGEGVRLAASEGNRQVRQALRVKNTFLNVEDLDELGMMKASVYRRAVSVPDLFSVPGRDAGLKQLSWLICKMEESAGLFPEEPETSARGCSYWLHSESGVELDPLGDEEVASRAVSDVTVKQPCRQLDYVGILQNQQTEIARNEHRLVHQLDYHRFNPAVRKASHLPTARYKRNRRLSGQPWCHIYIGEVMANCPNFDAAKRIIGWRGENTRAIFVATSAKIRLRGQTSGHTERGKTAPVPLCLAITSQHGTEGNFVEAVRLAFKLLARTEDDLRVFLATHKNKNPRGRQFHIAKMSDSARDVLQPLMQLWRMGCHRYSKTPN